MKIAGLPGRLTLWAVLSVPDLLEQDVCLLVDRIAELERELANAHRYLEACREIIGAQEGELLIDAIQKAI